MGFKVVSQLNLLALIKSLHLFFWTSWNSWHINVFYVYINITYEVDFLQSPIFQMLH
jgi:hypothetical protein